MKVVKYTDFRERIRKAVLDALDECVAAETESSALGWLDSELPQLFKAVDSHALKVATRLNERVRNYKINLDN